MQLTAPSNGFEELFCSEYPRIVAVIRRITSSAQAEDIAQEVFTAYLGSRAIQPDHARAWLQRVAVHRALNAVRNEKRRAGRERSHQLLDNAATSGKELDPARSLERMEIISDVRAALSRISQRHATILAMRYGGLRYKEISEAMNVSSSAIGTLLVRAEQALKKEIERVAPPQ